jgi:hypothetical protein
VRSQRQGLSFTRATVRTTRRVSWTKPSYRSEARSAGGITRCCGSCSTAQECNDRSGGHGLSGATRTPSPSGRLSAMLLTIPSTKAGMRT